MAELQDRLQVLAAAYQDAARPPGPASARRRGRRRRRHQAGGAGLLALALLAAGLTLGSQLLQEPRSAAPAAGGGGGRSLEAIPPRKDVVDGFNQRTGPIQLVTEGGAGRAGWKLATYPSGERTCSVVIRDGDPLDYGCGFDVPGRRPVMAVWTGPRSAADGLFVHGQVVREAARVRIEFSNQAPIELPALAAPTDVGVRFVAVSLRLPAGVRPTATVALDEHGRELGRDIHRFVVTEGGG
jgi:hypothetical protein